jgi:hypothetical protein
MQNAVHRELWSPRINHRDVMDGNVVLWRKPATQHVYGWLQYLNPTSAAEDRTAHNLRMMAYSFIACSFVFLEDETDLGPASQYPVESFSWAGIRIVFCCGDEPLAPGCPLLRLDTMNTKYFAAVTMRFSSWLSL